MPDYGSLAYSSDRPLSVGESYLYDLRTLKLQEEISAVTQQHIVWVYSIIVLYTVSPFLSMLIAGKIAKLAGCQLNEGSANPCIICRIDISEILYAMFVAGWLIVFTIPTGLLAFVGFSIFVAIQKWG